MIRAILLAALFVPISGAISPLAADDAKDKSKADPAGAPLELSISGEAKYTLDLGGRSAAELKEAIDAAAKQGERPPAAPAVDLVVEIKNASDKPVQVWTAGDPLVLTLALKGKGAVNVDPPLAFTKEFRIPRAVEIAAGKSQKIPVKSLVSGFRGTAHWSYWLEPGGYELVATLKTGLSPAPKGAKEGMDGFGSVTLTSAPFRIVVKAK